LCKGAGGYIRAFYLRRDRIYKNISMMTKPPLSTFLFTAAKKKWRGGGRERQKNQQFQKLSFLDITKHTPLIMCKLENDPLIYLTNLLLSCCTT